MEPQELRERLLAHLRGAPTAQHPFGSGNIKPLDEATILAEAGREGRPIVVAENHSTIGGLGEAVASVLMRNGVHNRFRQVALPNEFLDAGALPTVHDRYGLSAGEVAKTIRAWVQ